MMHEASLKPARSTTLLVVWYLLTVVLHYSVGKQVVGISSDSISMNIHIFLQVLYLFLRLVAQGQDRHNTLFNNSQPQVNDEDG